MASALKAVSLDPGKDFEVVAFSFDPKDTPEIAAAKRQTYFSRYGRASTANGWHFLTGDPANIKAVMDAVGFHYKYRSLHRSIRPRRGIMVVTPEGKCIEYFYGVDYRARYPLRPGPGLPRRYRHPVDEGFAVLLSLRSTTVSTEPSPSISCAPPAVGFVLVCGAFLLVAFRHERRSDKRQLKRDR